MQHFKASLKFIVVKKYVLKKRSVWPNKFNLLLETEVECKIRALTIYVKCFMWVLYFSEMFFYFSCELVFISYLNPLSAKPLSEKSVFRLLKF